MVWFKTDDGFTSHPKVIQIPRADGLRALAAGTWILCGTWSSKHKLDGWVPDYAIDEAGGTIEGAEALVAVKLWHKRKGGYQFHNWAEFQPTRAEQDEASEKERVRKAEYRARVKASKDGAESGNVPTGQSPRPDTPFRSEPTRRINQDLSAHPELGVRERRDEGIIQVAAEHGVALDRLVVPDLVEFIDGRRKATASAPEHPDRYYPSAVRSSWREVLGFIQQRGLAS